MNDKTLIARAAELNAAGAAADATQKASKEAAGIVKRSSAFFADPRLITTKEGFNARYDMGEIAELATSIKTSGLLQPLRVKRIPADEAGNVFVLVDGERRLTAIKQLLKAGETFPDGIQVIIVDKAQDDVTSLIQMFTANTGKPLLPLEEADAYKRMRDAGMSVKQIGAAVGRKHMHVTEILALLEADDSVKDAVKSGAIGKTMAKQIATTARGDKGKQAELTAKAVAASKAGGGRNQKGAMKEAKAAIETARREKAAKKGKTLKIRALSDAELSKIGATLAAAMAGKMKDAGKALDFDLADWIAKDDKLALAATYGALEALKAAAGMTINLDF